MSKFKMRHKQEENHEAWLMTYADFITLMASFFVLIISVSEPKKDRMEAVREGLAGFVKNMVETPFTDTYERIQLIIQDKMVDRDVAVVQTSQGVEVELASSAFFKTGSAELLPEAIPVLEEVADALVGLNEEKITVEVQGHTDDVPIATPLFPSNWELSAGRAATVVRFLIEKGMSPGRMKASGYSDVAPKVPNLDETGSPIDSNRVQNRRVVIKVEKKQGG